jgi:hypothetical protein
VIETGGDTIGRAVVVKPTVRATLADFVVRMICARWDHRWRLWAEFPHGKRLLCERCLSNRIEFPDGETVEATKLEIGAGDVRFGEALYEARWGEPPRQKMRVGEWPAP